MPTQRLEQMEVLHSQPTNIVTIPLQPRTNRLQASMKVEVILVQICPCLKANQVLVWEATSTIRIHLSQAVEQLAKETAPHNLIIKMKPNLLKMALCHTFMPSALDLCTISAQELAANLGTTEN